MPAQRFCRRHTALAQLGTLLVLTAMTISGSNARPLPAPLSGSAQPVIERFLLNQTVGLPGKVSITIDTPMSGTLPSCEALEPFIPNGTRLWGRVSIGVRCNAAQPWTRYVPAYVAVVGNYYVATRSINAGETLGPTDFAVRESDLTTLPRSVITNPMQLNGVVAINHITSGAPLRLELLRGAIVVQQGQNVKVMAQGPGFVASIEGKAMTNATVGAAVQVKMPSGQMVSGIVRGDGAVELPR